MTLERISHYRVHRLLGAGGMGEVYLAEDPRLNRKVALKLLPERFSDDPERVRRFQREARAASQLNHPNIITIYEVGRDLSRHYIAAEYVEGETLRDRIASERPMSVVNVVDVAIGIAGALAAAHEAGILHRDIKPENVMLRPDGYVKVLDFGLAKLALDPGVRRESTTGAIMGTLTYLSPEQARGSSPDARSDIYALGAVVYEMITRQPPISTASFVELAIALATKDPEPPSHGVLGVPPDLDRIVMKALQKEPQLRYQTAREMLSDLRALRQELDFETKLTLSPGHRESGPLEIQPTARLLTPRKPLSGLQRFRQRLAQRQAATIAVLVLCAALVAYAVGRNTGDSGGPIDSVAVLPFVNVSGDPSSEYLSDGIAESIIDSLTRFPRLQVVARSTTFRYRGKNVDPVAVGNELHVRGVITGQLISRGDTLVIRASLTDVKRGTQVWGEQYNRRLADVLAVQREMSDEISSGLRMRLTGAEKALLERPIRVSPEAYQAYLRGRYHLNRLTEEEVRKALVYFNQAIELQPDYALAYTGVARGYYLLSNVYMAPNEAMPRARAAAEQAVRLDDQLPEAHTALALVRTWYDWNFNDGEREFRRALELNPNGTDAHRFYGDFLIVTRQFPRAIAEKKRAEQLDPLSIAASIDVGRAYFYAGRFDEASQQVRKTLDLDPAFPNAFVLQAQIAIARGRLPEAVQAAGKAIAIGGRKPYYISMWGYTNALAGNRHEAEEAIRELSASQDYTLPLFVARIRSALGQREEALRALDTILSEKSESMVWLKVDPTLASLRGDPRFETLVRQVGL